jgi:hypothetical protein
MIFQHQLRFEDHHVEAQLTRRRLLLHPSKLLLLLLLELLLLLLQARGLAQALKKTTTQGSYSPFNDFKLLNRNTSTMSNGVSSSTSSCL